VIAHNALTEYKEDNEKDDLRNYGTKSTVPRYFQQSSLSPPGNSQQYISLRDRVMERRPVVNQNFISIPIPSRTGRP